MTDIKLIYYFVYNKKIKKNKQMNKMHETKKSIIKCYK